MHTHMRALAHNSQMLYNWILTTKISLTKLTYVYNVHSLRYVAASIRCITTQLHVICHTNNSCQSISPKSTIYLIDFLVPGTRTRNFVNQKSHCSLIYFS